MTWSAPSHDGGSPILIYKIFRNPVPTPTIPWIINASTDETWCNDTSVEAGTTYDYFVIAYNQIGEGKVSNITIKTAAAPISTSIDWTLYAGIAIVLVAVTGAAFVMIRKRK